MIAMQYSNRLPADYDMGIIHRRVETKGSAFDGWNGLVQKSFLLNEAGQDWRGLPVFNEYSPFYVWQNETAMRDFLIGPGFAALVQSFGRPIVRSWQVLEYNNPGGSDQPVAALRETTPLPETISLAELVRRERDLQKQYLEYLGLHTHVAGFDPERWEILRFTSWTDPHLAQWDKTSDSHSYYVKYLAC